MSSTQLQRSPPPSRAISVQRASPVLRPAIAESLAPESDSALVRMAKQDIRAFAPLYERYRVAILRYCFRSLGDWDDAADATQQTFANALAGMAQFRDEEDSFRPWLFRIAHNEVIDRHRQRRRRPETGLPADVDWIAETGLSLEEQVISADEGARVRVLLLRLTPDQRRCCAMRLSGLSHRETANALGKSEVAVRASCRRGLATLRELIYAER